MAREPFSNPLDDGVYSIEGGNSFQSIRRDDDGEQYESTDTKPLELPVEEVAEPDGYFFRRHFREPLFRLLPTKQAPRAYVVLLTLAAIVFAVGVIVSLMSQDVSYAFMAALVSVVLYAYPMLRESYRWRHRTVWIQRTAGGIEITYGEPDNILMLFEGSGDGDSVRIEGSMGHTKKIGWLNRFLFWGCGDLFISGKIEGYAPTDIFNVPQIKRVIAFLDGGD